MDNPTSPSRSFRPALVSGVDTHSGSRLPQALLLATAGLFCLDTAFSEELSIQVPLLDKGISTYYVQGRIAGQGEIDLLVDTGAGYTAINEKTLKKLKKKGLARHIRDVAATLADGKKVVVPIYMVDSLEIGDSCKISNVEVAVLPGDSRCILGLTALKRVAPFMVSVDPPAISLSNCDTSVGQNTLGVVR
jgi:hypothetical protein